MPVSDALRLLASRYTLLALFAADLLLVGLACSLRPGQLFDFVGPWSIPAVLVVVKSIAAGLAGFLAFEKTASARERWWFLALSAGLAGYGIDAATGWLLRTPEALFPRAPHAVGWILAVVPLFLGTVSVLLATSKIAKERRNPSWVLFEAAAALVVFSSVVVLLNLYLRPYLVEPWRLVVSAAAYLAHALVFLGCLALATGPRHRAPESSA
jgi:hypothetical protein